MCVWLYGTRATERNMDGGTGDIASDGYHKYKVSLNGEKFKGQFD